MFGFMKSSYSVAGVNTTLTGAGLDKKIARHITSSLPKEAWDLIRNCSKDLNPQCANLCNSIYAATVFMHFNEDKIGWELADKIDNTISNVFNAVEYQKQMGNKEALDESQRRFEYVGETYFEID